MEPNLSPVIVYTVQEYRENSNLVHEHIFMGSLLDEETLKKLNSGRKSHESEPIFKKLKVELTPAKSKSYYPIFIEHNDTISQVLNKISNSLKLELGSFYLWYDKINNMLTHSYVLNDNQLKINPNPFKPNQSTDMNRLFETYGNLNVVNTTEHLLRSFLKSDQRVLSLITNKNLVKIDNGIPTNLWKLRFHPKNFQIKTHDMRDLMEIQCLSDILRNPDLPVDTDMRQNSKINTSYMKKCVLHINHGVYDESFINLETIFQLISLDETYIFTKMKVRDRSISKISKKKVQNFKLQVSKELLAEWADTEDHHRGLLYRKLKNSPGLVVYRIFDNGSINLEINWTSDKQKMSDQVREILFELDTLNNFIDKLNLIDYQLPEKETFEIPLASVDVMTNPNSMTKIIGIDYKTLYDTNRQGISWNAFNYLASTFGSYLFPIFIWKIYNKRDLQLETSLSEINLHYLKTNNVIQPERLRSVLYGLGLVGGISKEQTVPVETQKEIIVAQQDKIGYNNLDKETIDDKIKELKENNPGVLLNIKYDGVYYHLNVAGAHNLNEINEINYLILQCFKYYFHIGTVYKFIKNYNCPRLSYILNLDEKVEDKIARTSFDSSLDDDDEEEVEDVDPFNVSNLEEEDAMGNFIPEQETMGMLETSMIPRELAEIPEGEEINPATSKKVRNIHDYLKDVSPIFKTEYRRHGCTKNMPVVMTQEEFWKNYSRLKQRFKLYLSRMSKEDLKEYEDRFKKDLQEQNQDLDKFQKRVNFVYRRTTVQPDKSILDQIGDIAKRYHQGALMKVPLDKKKKAYSKEYFYLCPLRWCHFCRESRLSDEIGSDGTCAVCQSQIYTLPDTHNSHIGFPNSKKNTHINCLPCCFKNKTKFVNKIAECNVSHPTKVIAKPVDKQKTNIGYMLTGDIIPQSRYGYLDGINQGKLNDFFNDGAIFTKIQSDRELFVLKGVNNVGVKNSFLEGVSYLGPPDLKRKTPDELREYLVDALEYQDNLFFRLNNGLISSIFKTPDNSWDEALDDFKFHLYNDFLNEDLLWHFITMPGIMTEQGFNLLIIQRTPSQQENQHKYTMLCPIGIKMEDYFNPNKPVCCLIKLENNIYYPLCRTTSRVEYNNVEVPTTQIYRFMHYDINEEPHVRDLFNFAIKNCAYPINPFERDRVNLDQTILELEKTDLIKKDEPLNMVLNPYYQITSILIDVKIKNKYKVFSIPIKPSPIPLESSRINLEYQAGINYKFHLDQGESYTDYNETLNLIKMLIRKTNLPIKISSVVIDGSNDIFGYKLDNGLIFLFDPVPENQFKLRNYKVVLEEDPENINFSIAFQNREAQDERQQYVNQTTFQKESYQRLRFEISRNLFKNNKSRDKIIKILENDKSMDDKRTQIEKIVADLISQLAVIGQPDLKNYSLPQIRKLCSTSKDCQNDAHCVMHQGKCKVLLPKTLILPNDTVKNNTMERYVVLISDEILRNVIKRTELLTGKVSIYVNTNQMVYHTKQEILINQPDFGSQIDELYSRTTDYLDLLRKNYYVEPSEVFTREVEQNLYYFPELGWYKNTGLSRTDYIMNSRNVYDLLSEIMGDDIGEVLWDLISRNDWKKWLNAFRVVLPDEYGNIYQYSEFMEHIKYGRSTITDLHLSLISHKYKVKIIIMNRVPIGSRKFYCLGTTQAPSNSKTYLIFYRYEENFTYLVGKTPNLDLTNDSDVTYQFKEDRIPQKFFKEWEKSCVNDHKIQKSPDPIDFLIRNIPMQPESKNFVDDLDKVTNKLGVDRTTDSEPSPPRFSLLPTNPELIDEDEEFIKKSKSKSRSPSKSKSKAPRKRTPPKKLKFKKTATKKAQAKPVAKKLKFKTARPPAKKKLNFKTTRSRGRPATRSRSRSRGKLPTRSRSRTRATSRGRSRTRTTTTSRSRSRGKTTSRGRKLNFKKRR